MGAPQGEAASTGPAQQPEKGEQMTALAALALWLTAAPTWTWIALAIFVIIDAGLIARAARIDAQR